MSSGMNGTISRGVFGSVEEMQSADLRVGVRVDVYGGDTYDIYAENQGASIPLDNGMFAEVVDKPVDSYRGLWPDSGGSALKGETWQTQVGGTPTGNYYTALQNTSVDPVGDNVNWKVAGTIGQQNLSDYTSIVYKSSGGNSAVENMINTSPTGATCITDGSTWKRVSESSGDISDFSLINELYTSAFQKNTEGFTADALNLANESNYFTVVSPYGEDITVPIKVPSFVELRGLNSSISVIGPNMVPYNTISKTGNHKVTLVNDDIVTPWEVDCILYLDPEFKGGAFPQKGKIRRLGLQGDGTNEVGLAIYEGSYDTEDVQITGCIKGYESIRSWSSKHYGMKALGCALVFGEGTSQVLTQCSSSGHASVDGAYSFTQTTYSNLISCTSDGAPNGSFVLDQCRAFNMVGCGNEVCAVTTPGLGQAITFKNYCEVIVNGYLCVPVENSTTPLITVGSNCRIEINSFKADEASFAYTGPDIEVNGTDSDVEVSRYRSYSGGVRRDEPTVHIDPSASGSSVVVNLLSGNKKKYLRGATKENPTFELLRDKGNFNPTLTLGGVEPNSYLSRTGRFSKEGDKVTIYLELLVDPSEFPSQAGGFSIGLGSLTNTYIPSYNSSATIAFYSGVNTLMSSALFKSSTRQIDLYKQGSSRSEALIFSDLQGTNNIQVNIELEYPINTIFS